MRWVCGGGGGLLIGFCSRVYVCGRGQDWDQTMFVFVGLCWWSGLVGLKPGLAWHCCEWLLLIVVVVWIFLLVVTGFYCWRICGFVEFWLFKCDFGWLLR